MNKQQALEKIKELENYIKEIDSKPKRFNAEYKESYYMNCYDASTQRETCYKDFDDKLNYIMGNMFETREQAEANKQNYFKKLRILEWMEDNRKEFEPLKENYVIQYWVKDSNPSFYDFSSQLSKYVFTKEKAQECIDKFGQDLKLIFE